MSSSLFKLNAKTLVENQYVSDKLLRNLEPGAQNFMQIIVEAAPRLPHWLRKFAVTRIFPFMGLPRSFQIITFFMCVRNSCGKLIFIIGHYLNRYHLNNLIKKIIGRLLKDVAVRYRKTNRQNNFLSL